MRFYPSSCPACISMFNPFFEPCGIQIFQTGKSTWMDRIYRIKTRWTIEMISRRYEIWWY